MGMGFYTASRQTMDRFRDVIDEDPDDFLDRVGPIFQENRFELRGETYRRPIGGTQPEAIQTWVQRKSFYLVHNSPIDDRLFGSGLVDTLITDFAHLTPLYLFLWQIKSGREA